MHRISLASIVLFFSFTCAAVAEDQPAIKLWPADRIVQLDKPEKITERSKDPAKPNRSFTFVSEPTIQPFLPAHGAQPTAAVIVCPGGGYGGLAIDKEGYAVAQWLNQQGIAGVVLKYRVPTRKDDAKHLLPLQDVQRAMGLVRLHAKEWNIDPARVGVIGFSAGGHLAANVSNNNETRAYDAVDEADKLSCRPDFAILIYPAYLHAGDKLSADINVTAKTPPTFLVQAEDDHIGIENCLYYYLALKNAKVPGEMHLYPTGGHGYGLGVNGGPVATWPASCERWLRDLTVKN